MNSTRNDIIALAEGLIRTRGYNAFSYKDIAGTLGIKNAAVHYHFPSKSDLGRAVIEQIATVFHRQKKVWEPLSPTEKLDAFIGVYEQSQQQEYVCFMGALSAAYATLPSEMQQALSVTSMEIRNWVCSFLEEGKNRGTFHYTCSAREMTDLIISSLMSSLLLSRVGKCDVLESVKQAIYNLLVIQKENNNQNKQQ